MLIYLNQSMISVIFCEAVAIYGIIISIILLTKPPRNLPDFSTSSTELKQTVISKDYIYYRTYLLDLLCLDQD